MCDCMRLRRWTAKLRLSKPKSGTQYVAINIGDNKVTAISVISNWTCKPLVFSPRFACDDVICFVVCADIYTEVKYQEDVVGVTRADDAPTLFICRVPYAQYRAILTFTPQDSSRPIDGCVCVRFLFLTVLCFACRYLSLDEVPRRDYYDYKSNPSNNAISIIRMHTCACVCFSCVCRWSGCGRHSLGLLFDWRVQT